jgi:hypothetical protein
MRLRHPNSTPPTLLHEKQAKEFSPRFGASNHIARYTDLIVRGVANVRRDACGKSIQAKTDPR